MLFSKNKYSLIFYKVITNGLFLLVLFNTNISAQDYLQSPIKIDAQVDKSGVTIGDKITFTITIIADPDITSHPPDFNSHFKGFEIIDNGIKNSKKEGTQIRTAIWYRLRADEIGEFIIPSVPITFSAPDPKYPDRSVQGQILSPEVKIKVLSVLKTDGNPKDIRDIKPILEMEPDWKRLSLYFILSIFLVILFIIWAKNKKLAKRFKYESLKNPHLPHQLAIEELKSLKSKKLLQKNMFREHYFELSEIFRRYLGNRFSFPALDWTTEEINKWTSKYLLLTELLRTQMLNILSDTDQVKYAKAQPSTFVSENIMNSIDQFIQKTMEKPKSEETQRQAAI